MRTVVSLALAMTLAAGHLRGQIAVPPPPVITVTRFATWTPPASAHRPLPNLSVTALHDDYRTAGLVAGAVSVGPLVAAVSYAACRSSDSVHGCPGRAGAAGALGAVMGGVTGMLIGGLSPKHPGARAR